MPKNPRYRQHSYNNYYGNYGYGRNQNRSYNNGNQNNYNNYQAGYYEDYDTGYSNYRSRWETTRHVDEGSYRRDYSKTNGKKRCKNRSNNQKMVQDRRPAGGNKKPSQYATGGANRLLAALDKTAESVTNNASGVIVNKVARPTTAGQVVEEVQFETSVQNRTIRSEKEEVSPKQLRELQFQQNRNEALSYNSAKNLKSLTQGTTDVIPPTIVHTVEEHSSTSILNENIQNPWKEAAKHLPKINFQQILEEVEVNYKAARYAQRVEDHQGIDTYNDRTFKLMYDEVTLQEMALYRTLQAKEREELIKKTKDTLLYKAYKEQTKETIPAEDVLKTPDISITAARWKETYFKPWKLKLAKFGYRRLDGIDWEGNSDTDEQ